MQPGQIRYSLVTNDAGGILDDVLVYRLQRADRRRRRDSYLLVVNASNRQKIVDWISCASGRATMSFAPTRRLTRP